MKLPAEFASEIREIPVQDCGNAVMRLSAHNVHPLIPPTDWPRAKRIVIQSV